MLRTVFPVSLSRTVSLILRSSGNSSGCSCGGFVPVSDRTVALLSRTISRAEIDNGEFPDTALLGRTLFDKYNRSLVIAGLALLVASIGVVVLSRRPSGK